MEQYRYFSILFISLFSVLPCFGAAKWTPLRFSYPVFQSLYQYPPDSHSIPRCETIYGLDFGIFSTTATTVGGSQIGPLMSSTELLAGLQINVLGGYVQRGYGLQVSPIGNLAVKIAGVQIGAWNIAETRIIGIQTSLLLNNWEYDKYEYKNDVIGIQMASISNKSRKLVGLQVGGINSSESVVGLQIGIYNVCQTLKGIQIGLLNRIKSRQWLGVLPLINASW